jgi:hypothetical protein
LTPEKTRLAQAYYQVCEELAGRTLGSPQAFQYSNPLISNLPDVARLWSLQARHGGLGTTLASVPATLLSGVAGTLGGTPLEGATITDGKLTGVQAHGHGFNLAVNAASAVALGLSVAGRASSFRPLLAVLSLAGPLLTTAPLVAQRFGDGNAPVHEMAHSLQYLLLGDLLNKGVLDSRDLVTIQNTVDPHTGYLWGGRTEAAAHYAETTGDPSKIFQVLREGASLHLQQRYGSAAKPRLEALQKNLADNETWIKKRLTNSG